MIITDATDPVNVRSDSLPDHGEFLFWQIGLLEFWSVLQRGLHAVGELLRDELLLRRLCRLEHRLVEDVEGLIILLTSLLLLALVKAEELLLLTVLESGCGGAHDWPHLAAHARSVLRRILDRQEFWCLLDRRLRVA